MDEEFRRYQPAILTWYETAQHAFDRGASWQNMGALKIHSMVVSIISNQNLILSLKNLLGIQPPNQSTLSTCKQSLQDPEKIKE